MKKHYQPTPLKIIMELIKLGPLGLIRVLAGSKFKFLSLEEVVSQLSSGKSLVRWGDGETALARNKDIWFQTSNSDISMDLNDFWTDNFGDIVFALPRKPIEKSVLNYFIRRNDFWKEFSSRVYFAGKHNAIKNRIFGDTYIWYENVHMLRPIITDLISGKPSMLIASDEDIFKNLKNSFPEMFFLRIPKREIYNDRNRLISEIKNWINANKGVNRPIILLAAGPVGKIIARTMDDKAQFIDVGHGFVLELGKDLIIVEQDQE